MFCSGRVTMCIMKNRFSKDVTSFFQLVAADSAKAISYDPNLGVMGNVKQCSAHLESLNVEDIRQLPRWVVGQWSVSRFCGGMMLDCVNQQSLQLKTCSK